MYQVGLDCKLYYNSATYAMPTWVEVADAGDVTINIEATEAEIKRRGLAFTEYLAGQLGISLEFPIVRDTGDTVYSAIQSAILGRSNLEFAVMDGDIATSGQKGYRITCKVFGFNENEPLEEGATTEITAKPTPNSDAAPATYTVP